MLKETNEYTIMKNIILLVGLLIGLDLRAQPTEFRFSARFGGGRSTFFGPAASFDPGMAFDAGVSARWRYMNHLLIDFSPTVDMKSGAVHQEEHAANSAGRRVAFPYKDIYQVYTVAFPATFGYSIDMGNWRAFTLAGGGMGFPMGGLHTKHYADPGYNAANGYAAHQMKGLVQNYWFMTADLGIERPLGRNCLGIDLRFVQTNAIASLEEVKFAARALTLGLSWKVD